MADSVAQRRFVEAQGEKPQRAPKPRQEIKRGKRPAPSKFKHALESEYLRGVREAFIFLQNRLDEKGAHCWNCGRKARRLDLHHVIPRARGGHHAPGNLELWCSGFPGSCHWKEHGEPRWRSQEDAS